MEIQLAGSLPYLADSATDRQLQEILYKQSNRTYRRKTQLLALFRHFGIELGTDKCLAIEGLTKGGEKHLADIGFGPIRDLMLIAHCLRVAHYGIAAYQMTARLAELLGMLEEAALLATLAVEETDAADGLVHMEPLIFEMADQREKSLIGQ